MSGFDPILTNLVNNSTLVFDNTLLPNRATKEAFFNEVAVQNAVDFLVTQVWINKSLSVFWACLGIGIIFVSFGFFVWINFNYKKNMFIASAEAHFEERWLRIAEVEAGIKYVDRRGEVSKKSYPVKLTDKGKKLIDGDE